MDALVRARHAEVRTAVALVADPPVALEARGGRARAAAGVAGHAGEGLRAGVVREDLRHAGVVAVAAQVGAALEHDEAPIVREGRVRAGAGAARARAGGAGEEVRDPDLRDAGVVARDRVARRLEHDAAAPDADRRVPARARAARELADRARPVREEDLPNADVAGAGQIAGRLEGADDPDQIERGVLARAGGIDDRPVRPRWGPLDRPAAG